MLKKILFALLLSGIVGQAASPTFQNVTITGTIAGGNSGSTITTLPVQTASSAGTTDANGAYSFTGTLNSRPAFSSALYDVQWSGSTWRVLSGTTTLYTSSSNVATPDLATFTVASGTSPAPTFAASTVSRAVNGTFFDWAVSVKTMGATGDGVTDDTAAIQAALDTRRAVYIPNGDYRISSSLKISTLGQNIRGESKTATLITQSGTAEHGFLVLPNARPNTTNGPGLIEGETNHLRISNLFLIGPGKGTSTGYGVTRGDGASGWGMESTTLSDMIIQGWKWGVDFNTGSSQVIQRVYAKSCEHGFHWRGSAANTNLGYQLGAASCDVGMYFNQSGASSGHFDLGDFGLNGTHIEVANGGSWVFNGGEIESATNYAFDVTDAKVTIIGGNILWNSSSTLSPIQARGAANIALSNISIGQLGTGIPLAKVNSSNCKISGRTNSSYGNSTLGSSDNTWATDSVMLADGTTARISAFPIVDGGTYPTPSVNLRGATIFSYYVASSVGDDIRTVVRSLSGNYTWASLTRPNLFRLVSSSATVGGTGLNWIELSSTGTQTYNLLATSSVNIRASADVAFRTTIKDTGGNAGTSAKTINPNGSDTINGVNSALTIRSNYGAVTLVTTGSGAWNVESTQGDIAVNGVRISAAPMFSGTTTLSVSSLATLTTYEQLIPVTGATTTGTPSIAIGLSGTMPSGLLLAGNRVVATGTVGVSLYNATLGNITDTSTVIRATVIQP